MYITSWESTEVTCREPFTFVRHKVLVIEVDGTKHTYQDGELVNVEDGQMVFWTMPGTFRWDFCPPHLIYNAIHSGDICPLSI